MNFYIATPTVPLTPVNKLTFRHLKFDISILSTIKGIGFNQFLRIPRKFYLCSPILLRIVFFGSKVFI